LAAFSGEAQILPEGKDFMDEKGCMISFLTSDEAKTLPEGKRMPSKTTVTKT
jgi:hypothetical protein